MTRQLTEDYFRNRTFYNIQSSSLIDNPDQRIASDVRQDCPPRTSALFKPGLIYLSGPMLLQIIGLLPRFSTVRSDASL